MDTTTTLGIAVATAGMCWSHQPWLRRCAGLPAHAQRTLGPVVVTALAVVLACTAVGQLRPAVVVFVLLAVVAPHLFTADLQQRRLPAALTRPVIVLSVLVLGVDAAVMADPWPTVHALLAGLAGRVVFTALRMLSRGGMGRGDITLSRLLGLQLGWLSPGTAVLGLLLGFVLAAAALTPKLLTRRLGRRTKVPFGPFMLLGAWSAVATLAVAPFTTAASATPTTAWISLMAVLVAAVLAAGWTLRAARTSGAAGGPVLHPEPLSTPPPGLVLRQDTQPASRS